MRKGRIICLILLEAVLLFMLFCPVLVNDRRHVHAFVEWRKNRTPETEARWERENSRLHRDMMIDYLTLLGAVLLNTAGIVVLIKRGKTGHNHTPDGIRQPADGSPKPSV